MWNYNQRKPFEKISNKIKRIILIESFSIAVRLIKKGFANKFINGPISKKTFLGKKRN